MAHVHILLRKSHTEPDGLWSSPYDSGQGEFAPPRPRDLPCFASVLPIFAAVL